MDVIGYCRVSTEEQAVHGCSLAEQRAALVQWCEANGHLLVTVYEDAGISGSTTQHRPAFLAAVAEAKRHKAILAVKALSRASRSVRDAHGLLDDLDKAGAAFASVTEHIDTSTATGKLIFGVFALFAQFERDLLSERVTAALAHKKRLGERVGHIPYGMRLAADGVHLEEDPEEAKACNLIRAWGKAGYSLRTIQGCLDEAGYSNRKGNRFRLDTIAQILRRKTTLNPVT